MIIKLIFISGYKETSETDKIEVFPNNDGVYFGEHRDRQEILSTLKEIKVEDN